MKAIILNGFRKGLKYDPNHALIKLNSKQRFLIKVYYASVNPSDLGFISGIYGRQSYIKNLTFPLIPGFEGSGVIVDTFDKESKSLIGKKVCFCSNYEKTKLVILSYNKL